MERKGFARVFIARYKRVPRLGAPLVDRFTATPTTLALTKAK